MKRYNYIAKSLIPDIIPALEKSHEKWITGARQTKAEYRGWWTEMGSVTCALCDLCYFDKYMGGCGSCPLKDKDENRGGCAIEWNSIYKCSSFPNFHKQSALLRDRIGKLLKRARKMVA